MIPILYQNTETAFTSNGVGRLTECIKCVVTEERNGVFECEFQYPITGKRYADIVEGMYIFCTHDDTKKAQPFEIYARSAVINGIVTFYARHISYKLNNIVLSPFSAGSATEAMVKINEHSINTNPFTFWTDKSTVANFNLSHPSSVRGILGGSQGSLLDVYGGEYEFDMFTVKLHSARGANTDVTIRYGKNLTDLRQEIDNGGSYDAVVPYWKQEDKLVMLDEKVVEGSHGRDKLAPLDLTSAFQNEPTKAQLKARAQSYLNNKKPWIPDENIKINFVALWQTTQYKDVASLQRVKLCDTISVYYPALGVTANNVKVIKTKYNVLLDRYDEIELGNARSSFAETIVKKAQEGFGEATKNLVTTSAMQKAIDHATQLISGGLGGHVVFNLNANGEPEEILVMDTADTSTAVNVIRMNANGIGFSTNGYNGPFNTAWTIDGNFVADFITTGNLNASLITTGVINANLITTGTLNANLIKTGVLADTNNNTMFNLSTGELTMKKGSINLGNGKFTVSNNGSMVAKDATIYGDILSVSTVTQNFGTRYSRIDHGNYILGGLKDGVYTPYCSISLSVQGGLPTMPKDLSLEAKDGNIYATSTSGGGVYLESKTGNHTNSHLDVHSTGIVLNSDHILLQSDDITIRNGANISAVKIPTSIGEGGYVTQYYNMKIVSGILMNA